MALIYCPECGNQTSDQAEACNKCGYPISKLNFNQKQNDNANTIHSNTVNSSSNFSVVDSFYQKEFEEIQKSNEEYRGRFNWFAFFFSWLWLFSKGAWGWGIVLLILNLGLNILILQSNNIGTLVFVLVIFIGVNKFLGHNATKIYYNVIIKKQQF